jgi:hypothetical protein
MVATTAACIPFSAANTCLVAYAPPTQ